MPRLTPKKIVEWKSLKRFYAYYDDFLDDLQTRDSHDPAPYKQRVHYVPSHDSGEGLKRIGKLTESDLLAFKRVREVETYTKVTDAAAKILDFEEQRQKYVESPKGKFEREEKEKEIQRELNRLNQSKEKQKNIQAKKEKSQAKKNEREAWSKNLLARIEEREAQFKKERKLEREERTERELFDYVHEHYGRAELSAKEDRRILMVHYKLTKDCKNPEFIQKLLQLLMDLKLRRLANINEALKYIVKHNPRDSQILRFYQGLYERINNEA